MNIQQALNRGYNLLAVSIAGLAGMSFLPEAFVEKDIPDKIDDILLFIIAVIAIVWYNKSNNKYVRSAVPMALVIIGLVVKVAGLLIEIDDPESFGDDIGGVVLFAFSAWLVISQYKKNAKLLTM